MALLNPYLNFRGNAREAMEFYWLSFLMGPLGLPVSFQRRSSSRRRASLTGNP